MRQRAVHVDLEPRIEGPCLYDLAEYCSENVGKGEVSPRMAGGCEGSER